MRSLGGIKSRRELKKMTQLEIVRLAWHESLEIWNLEKKYLEEDPDNEIDKAREAEAWRVEEELSGLLKELEDEEGRS